MASNVDFEKLVSEHLLSTAETAHRVSDSSMSCAAFGLRGRMPLEVGICRAGSTIVAQLAHHIDRGSGS